VALVEGIDFDPLSPMALITMALLSALSVLIIHNNRRLLIFGVYKTPLTILAYLLSLSSYIGIASVHVVAFVMWYVVVGLPVYLLYWRVFSSLWSELPVEELYVRNR
jgi:hypothetical protein